MFETYDGLREENNYLLLDELMSQGFDPTRPDLNGTYVLNPVCKALNVELAEKLIQAGADVNALSSDGFTPLLSAIDCSHHDPDAAVKIVSLLLDNGADIEKRGDWDKTPFLKSCTRGVIGVTRLLVDRGCDLNAQAKEIGGPIGGREFADMSTNNNIEFRRYIEKLVPQL